MKLLILEFICGGCWEESELPASLHKEGWLMLKALLADAVQIPRCEVFTTWDERLGNFPLEGINVTTIARPQDFRADFSYLMDQMDQVLIIAPEFDHHLYNLVKLVEGKSCLSLNCSLSAIDCTSSKSVTKDILRDHQIPTIKEMSGSDFHEFPFVMKPVDGAGSTDNWCICSTEDWNTYQSHNYSIPMLTEPFIPGQHFSMGVIVNQVGHIDYLPLAAQHIEVDRKITYRGGRVPVQNIDQKPFQQLAERCLKVIPGLSGYCGIDMILPDDDPLQPIVVEINPRFTTSYIGYRQLTTINLLERILSRSSAPHPIPWKDTMISWDT